MDERVITGCKKQQEMRPISSSSLRIIMGNPEFNIIVVALIFGNIWTLFRMDNLHNSIVLLRHDLDSQKTLAMKDYPATNILESKGFVTDNRFMTETNDSNLVSANTRSFDHEWNNSVAHNRSKRNTPNGHPPRKAVKERRSKMEAFHLQVDSTMYSMEIEHAKQTLNIWRPRDSRQMRFGEYRDNGLFRVNSGGLYYVYSQITYYDNAGRWCHVIKKNSKIIAKCLTSEWGMPVDRTTHHYVRTAHNCFTATVIHLHENDVLSIASLYGRRTIHQGTDMTFWGIVKLS